MQRYFLACLLSKPSLIQLVLKVDSWNQQVFVAHVWFDEEEHTHSQR